MVTTPPATAPDYTIHLTGQYCTIVPLSPSHAESLYNATSDPHHASLFDYLAFSQPPSAAAFKTAIDSIIADTSRWTYTILVPDGSGEMRAAGMCSLMRMDQPNGVVEIGHILFTPLLQRTRAATEAMYLIASYVFDTLGFRRYEWKCNDLNLPSKQAAKRYGFVFEGVFRQHMVQRGRNRDTAWFSIIDQDWPVVRKGMEKWLDPGNFDDEGKQRRRLEECRK